MAFDHLGHSLFAQGGEVAFDHLGHSLFAVPPKHACKQADTQATTRPKSGEIQEFVFATRGQRPKQSNAKTLSRASRAQ